MIFYEAAGYLLLSPNKLSRISSLLFKKIYSRKTLIVPNHHVLYALLLGARIHENYGAVMVLGICVIFSRKRFGVRKSPLKTMQIISANLNLFGTSYAHMRVQYVCPETIACVTCVYTRAQ